MGVWVLRGSGADPDHSIAWGEGAGPMGRGGSRAEVP